MAYVVRTTDSPGDVGRAADQNQSVNNDKFFKAGSTYVQVMLFDWNDEVVCAVADGVAYLPGFPSGLDGRSLLEAHVLTRNAGTTGTIDIQIQNVTQAVDMLSTVITIDSTEVGSDTAAAPAVIKSDGSEIVDAYDVLRFDVDAVHTTPAEGAIITLRFG